jgi:hypothetical protein
VKVVTFAEVQLGDELLACRAEPERLVRQDDPLLWSEVGYAPEASPNWLWRISVVVLARSEDALALDGYVSGLAALVRGQTGDVVVTEGSEVLRRYPACRLDRVSRSAPKDASRGNFDASLTFTFTTASDPLSE